jgi:hypothetical protein
VIQPNAINGLIILAYMLLWRLIFNVVAALMPHNPVGQALSLIAA